MQKLPRLTATLALAAIAFGGMQLRNVVHGRQQAKDTEPATEPAAPAAPVASPEATELLRAARDRLTKWKSIQANVVQRVEFVDRKFQAEGRFISGEFPRTRLDYQVRVGGTIGRLLEVCDGQVLHIERRIEDAAPKAKPVVDSTEVETPKAAQKLAPEAIRRDIQRVLRATAAADADAAALSLHAADISLGGLPALLASLDRTMIFDAIRAETHEGQRFLVIQGTWNPARLQELKTRLGGLAAQMVAFMPERVRISFDAETLFPVRILYLKLTTGEKKAYRPMLVLEFHDVEFDAELPADTFSYHVPTGVQQKDDTDEFIQILKSSEGPAAAAPAQEGTKLNLQKPRRGD